MSKEEKSPTLTPLDKDIDVLPGYDVKQLKPSMVNILEQQVSVNEAFDNAGKVADPFAPSSEDADKASSLGARWSKFKSICIGSFETRASDFAKSELKVLFSKRVRDRLAELEVANDEAKQITLMQQNEERLKAEIKRQSVELEKLHKASMHWEMIELISSACELLTNTKSPQFYPAQFMLVLDLVECFGQMVYDRLRTQRESDNYLTEKDGTRQLLALNWSMILCRTSKLLPRLLLQTAFLRCVKFHPFKTLDESINQIVDAMAGLGSASAGIYARAYFVYTIWTHFPETACDLLLPLFTGYARGLMHLKNGGFQRQFKIMDYQFSKYVETHAPALRFFLSVLVSNGDPNFLKTVLDEFYSLGEPSSFILGALFDELPPKFVGKIYPVLLMLIDRSDDVIPHPVLIYKLLVSLTQTTLNEGIVELMNDIWNRMREFKDVEDFVYVAAPMTKFIAKFCSQHYLNLFLTNVAELLRHNFAARQEEGASVAGKQLSKKLAGCVSECIVAAVCSSPNFADVLSHVGAVVDLMDFLNQDFLVEISRMILTDVSQKSFELNDPLCIRILLELAQILFQSLSVLSAVDVIEKVNKAIEWFIYRVDFGPNVETHLNFLLSARQSFPSSNRLQIAVAKVALRLCTQVWATKPRQYDVIMRSLLAFAFVTIPSVSDPFERAKLYLAGANVALISTVTCFTHPMFEEFSASIKLAKANAQTFNLYMEALNLLLIMPSNPDAENPYEHIRQLIIDAVRREWGDDEAVRFALESLIMMSHSLRSEYVMRVPDVDSNDVLFAGNQEFRNKAQAFITQMLPRFIGAIQRYKGKGVMAAKTKVPALALRAIGALPDVFVCDDVLIATMKQLANMTVEGDSRQLQELKRGTIYHLRRILADNESAMQFLRIFAGGDDDEDED